MKIELKNIQHSPSLSEETEAFTANLYINNVLAGYAKNNGHGGNTDYHSSNEQGRELISQAEAYCKTQPVKNLEYLIDDLLTAYLNQKEQKQFDRKMEKAMLNGLVIGKPEEPSFTSVAYKIPLSVLLTKPGGAENLKNTIKSVIPELTGGVIILNANIPEEILKDAGLNPDQYNAYRKEPIKEKPTKKPGKKL